MSLLALLGLIAAAQGVDLQARIKAAPMDVRMFIERRAECDHWLGEEPYDGDRAAQITEAILELECARLPRDEAELRRRYRARPDVLDLISVTDGFLG